MKKKTISQLNKLNSQYLKVVYKGLIDQKSIRDINKDIRKITIQQKNAGLPFNIKDFLGNIVGQVNKNKVFFKKILYLTDVIALF